MRRITMVTASEDGGPGAGVVGIVTANHVEIFFLIWFEENVVYFIADIIIDEL